MTAAGEKVIVGLEQAVARAKGPQFTTGLEMLVSSTPSANGQFHLYLADTRRRKVAALWGGNAEKMANGYLWSSAPELYEALEELLESYLDALPGSEDYGPVLAASAALTKARGEQ
jgi:hypothetical protein